MNPKQDRWANWMFEYRHGGDTKQFQVLSNALQTVRNRILQNAQLVAGDTILDVGTGDGLIAVEALRIVGEHGKVIFSDISEDLLNACKNKVQNIGLSGRSQYLIASADDLSDIDDMTIDVVTTRSVLIFVNKKKQAFQEFYRILGYGGRLSIFEPINQLSHPKQPHLFWGYDVTPLSDLGYKLYTFYENLQPSAPDPMYDFGERDLFSFAEQAGFSEIYLDLYLTKSPALPMNWETFLKSAGNPLIPTVEEAINTALTANEVVRFYKYLQPRVENGQGILKQAGVYLTAKKRNHNVYMI